MTQWFGQDRALAALAAALCSERLHHAWLFGGQAGIGKAGIATDFAKRLLGAKGSSDDGSWSIHSDDSTARLVDAGTHPDFIRVERAQREAKKGDTPSLARNITVDQIRGLSRFLHLAPSLAARRVILIDAAEDMERGAANALLKNLEEPPRDTVFLLISHVPGRLLPTIRSRCRFLSFSPLSDQAMDRVLAGIEPDMPLKEKEALIHSADGSPGRAIALHSLDLMSFEAGLSRIVQSGDPTNRERVALARALSSKAAQPRYEAFLDYVPHFIARRLRIGQAPHLADAWSEAAATARGALTLSLDPAATVFALCGSVARLHTKTA